MNLQVEQAPTLSKRTELEGLGLGRCMSQLHSAGEELLAEPACAGRGALRFWVYLSTICLNKSCSLYYP